MKLKNVLIFSLVLVFLLFPTIIFSDICEKPPCPSDGLIKIDNPLKSGANTLEEFIVLLIKNVILPVGGVIAVIYIIYAGFLLVTARGNETKLADAKRAFFYAAIGTMVLLGSWVIAEAIKGTIKQITG
jgi:hypothetical protein